MAYKMRCRASEARSRVLSSIQIRLYTSRMGSREKMHHTDFFTCLDLFFFVCVISLIQSSCKCPALDAPSSNLLSRPKALYHFFLARPLFHYLPQLRHQCRFVRVSCACVSLCSQRLASCMPCAPVYCSPYQGEGRRRVRKTCTISQNKG